MNVTCFIIMFPQDQSKPLPDSLKKSITQHQHYQSDKCNVLIFSIC